MTPTASVEPVVLWKCGDVWQTERPVACSCDGDPEQGPHTTEGDAIREHRALPAAEFDALMARIERAEAERDALRGEVATLRGASSAEDVCEMLCEASCVDVTPERCARIWSLLEHPATTMTTLAVIADERGESYAKVRALLSELAGRLRYELSDDEIDRIDTALRAGGG